MRLSCVILTLVVVICCLTVVAEAKRKGKNVCKNNRKPKNGDQKWVANTDSMAECRAKIDAEYPTRRNGAQFNKDTKECSAIIEFTETAVDTSKTNQFCVLWAYGGSRCKNNKMAKDGAVISKGKQKNMKKCKKVVKKAHPSRINGALYLKNKKQCYAVVRYSKLKKAKGWQTCVAKVGKVKGADYDYGDDVDTDGTTVDYFGDDDDNEEYEYDDEEYEYADDDDDGEYSGDDDDDDDDDWEPIILDDDDDDWEPIVLDDDDDGWAVRPLPLTLVMTSSTTASTTSPTTSTTTATTSATSTTTDTPSMFEVFLSPEALKFTRCESIVVQGPTRACENAFAKKFSRDVKAGECFNSQSSKQGWVEFYLEASANIGEVVFLSKGNGENLAGSTVEVCVDSQDRCEKFATIQAFDKTTATRVTGTPKSGNMIRVSIKGTGLTICELVAFAA